MSDSTIQNEGWFTFANGNKSRVISHEFLLQPRSLKNKILTGIFVLFLFGCYLKLRMFQYLVKSGFKKRPINVLMCLDQVVNTCKLKNENKIGTFKG